ncbi:unnamed protein product [Clonostachys rosea f. rosea IK726]|uniref:Uncharacterized protein n=1 Tax=Clonostachys rosea f. rosea IK726 TaxID=1349383 RepID=A0ACA9ULF5_BIOOC|nr:unnamed protein product [Clonostachys rosea f. rosea IK726]
MDIRSVMTQWRKPDITFTRFYWKRQAVPNWKSANRSPLFALLRAHSGLTLVEFLPTLACHGTTIKSTCGSDGLKLAFHFKTFEKQVLQSWGRVSVTQSLRISYSLQDLEQNWSPSLQPHSSIIFAASIGNSATEYDDIGVISELSREFPVTLHVNAFRSFDYVATMSETVSGTRALTVRATVQASGSTPDST